MNNVFLKKILSQTYTETSPYLIFVLKLIRKIMAIYGLGIYDFDSFLYTQPHSVYQLLQALCYNDYSNNQASKNSQQINYQKNQKGKQKNLIQLNLHQGTIIETHFEEYLRMTTEVDREELLEFCLDFSQHFYSKKK